MNNLPKIGVPLLIALTFGLLLVAKSIVTIGSGEAGVEYRLFGGGVVTDEPPLDEGLRFILPWNSVFIYEVRQQEVFEKMNVLSSNGLDIQLEAQLGFNLNMKIWVNSTKKRVKLINREFFCLRSDQQQEVLLEDILQKQLYSSKKRCYPN